MTAPPLHSSAPWTQRTLLLLLGLAVVKLALLAVWPLDLCADEAYYWDWTRQLDWGYYSKPPMIAGVIAATTALMGSSEFAIRLPAVLLSTVGLWPVYCLAFRMFDGRTGFYSVLLMAATPGITAMSFLMTIDAPFLCAWAFALWLIWALLEQEIPAWRWVIPAILATGAGLLSKQTMFAIFPLVGCWLLLQPRERSKLWSTPVMTWAAGSLLCLTPVIHWNAQHGWITLQHTSEHFQQRSVSFLQHFAWFIEFWGSQFAVLSPVSCGAMIALTTMGLWQWRHADRRILFLLCGGALPMTGVSVLSSLQRVQPNWPAPFVLTSFVLLAAWGCGHIPSPIPLLVRRKVLISSVSIGATCAAGLCLVPFLIPASPLGGTALDPTARLRGWEQLATQIADCGRIEGAAPPLVIAMTSRGTVSLMAYYLPDQPRVYRWNSSGLIDSQHDVWGGPSLSEKGRDALILTGVDAVMPAELQNAFARIEPLTTCRVNLGNLQREQLLVWKATDYRAWPGSVSPAQPHLQMAGEAGLFRK